jgi:hypothetical protein
MAGVADRSCRSTVGWSAFGEFRLRITFGSSRTMMLCGGT